MAESLELDKAAKDAESHWDSQANSCIIVAGMLGLLSISDLPCETVKMIGVLFLLFVVGMAYPTVCAYQRLRYLDRSIKRVKNDLTKVKSDLAVSMKARPKRAERFRALLEDVEAFEKNFKSGKSVQLILHVVVMVGFFLVVLWLAYDGLYGKY